MTAKQIEEKLKGVAVGDRVRITNLRRSDGRTISSVTLELVDDYWYQQQKTKSLEILEQADVPESLGEFGRADLEAAAETLNSRLRVSALNPERQEPAYAASGRYAMSKDEPVLLRARLIESVPEWAPPKKRHQPRAIEELARHLELPHARYVHRVNLRNCEDLEVL